MKLFKPLIMSMLVILLFSACHDKVLITQTLNEPVYLTYEELRIPVATSHTIPLQKPGKIYVKDQLIFVNESMKGIHVIDNTDPGNPVDIGFLEIPGNVDISVKGNILYADSYTDLVALDISDPENISETGRAEGILPYIIPWPDNEYPVDYDALDEDKGVVLSWELKETTKEVTNQVPIYPQPWINYYRFGADMLLNSGSSGGSGVGMGGSMARFTIAYGYLYALTTYDLRVIGIDDPQQMLLENKIYPGSDLETIFPYGDLLFLGSQSGMAIYSLANDPLNPEYVSRYTHIRSCDPVVVQGAYAYVTLRVGSACGGVDNSLEVVDITNPYMPVRKGHYAMDHPYGLGINGSKLYVCDGESGLKSFDATDPLSLQPQQTYLNVHAWDVIAMDSLLLMIGDNGLYQYKPTGETLQLLSSILIDMPAD